jgi:hypothetical protein
MNPLSVYGIDSVGFGKMQVVASPMLRVPIYEKRNWKERLFTLPFRPFQAQKIVGYKALPFGVKANDVLFVPPEMLESLMKLSISPTSE